MMSLLNRSLPVDPRGLEQLIYDVVAEYDRVEDFHILYKLMHKSVVFVPVESKSIPKHVQHGTRYTAKQGDLLHCYTVPAPQNQILVVCATGHDASIIDDGYVEMDWRDFLVMSLKCDASVYGVLLQGRIERERISYILALS